MESTPKSSTKGHNRKKTPVRDSPGNPYLSPIQLTPSRSPSQGNLTGSARKVKDAVADLHNNIQKWEAHNSKGAALISKISNAKMEAVFSAEQAAEEGDEVSMVTSLPQVMEKYCEALTAVVSAMEKLVQKCESMCKLLCGVCELELHQNNNSWDPIPLFFTWNTGKFYDVTQELVGMYQKEHRLKKCIAENVAHCSDRDLMMFYNSLWVHQPYIEPRAEALLESMIQETGLT